MVLYIEAHEIPKRLYGRDKMIDLDKSHMPPMTPEAEQ